MLLETAFRPPSHDHFKALYIKRLTLKKPVSRKIRVQETALRPLFLSFLKGYIGMKGLNNRQIVQAPHHSVVSIQF